MAVNRRYDPGSVFEDEGIPDLQDGTPGQQLAVDPQEMPLPTDAPAAVENFGVTASEQRAGEPLAERLKQEEPDFGEQLRRPGHAQGDPGGGSEPSWPQSEPYAVGRLVAPDHGLGEDTEAQALAEDYGADGGGFSAEEAAVHMMVHEPPLEDAAPDYTEPTYRE